MSDILPPDALVGALQDRIHEENFKKRKPNMGVLKAMFSESNSVSCMRVMNMLALLAAIGFGIIGLCKPGIDISSLTMLCSAFLSAAFIGKVSQKAIEARQRPTDG